MTNDNGKSGVTPTESKTTSTAGHVPHGSRETPVTSVSSMGADRAEKARCHDADAYVAGESDSSIVPGKPTNEGSVPLPAEWVEGRSRKKQGRESFLIHVIAGIDKRYLDR